MLTLEDDQAYKRRRIEYFFNFGQDPSYGNQGGGPSSGQGTHQTSSFYQPQAILNFLSRAKSSHPIYSVRLLNFVAMLALRDQTIMDLVKGMTAHKDWIWTFIHRIGQDTSQIQRA
jgi:hypothetical protein